MEHVHDDKRMYQYLSVLYEWLELFVFECLINDEILG